MGKINITAEMKAAAISNSKLLTTIVRNRFDDLKTKYGFHHKKGLYGTEKAGLLTVDGKMAPYNTDEAALASIDIIINDITTYHGKNYEKVEIAELEETIYGKGIVTPADWKKSDLGKKILADWVLANLESITDSLWDAKRNSTGTTTVDLFDGFDTQLTNAISAGKLSSANDNLTQMSEAIDNANALDILLQQYEKLPQKLRKKKLRMHVPESIYAAYCKSYQVERGNINDKDYDQQYLFGTRNRVILTPHAERADDAPIIWTVPKNMTIGTGGRGAKERYEVKEDNNVAFLQFIHEMFFGASIACYHPTFFHVTEQFPSTGA